VSVWEGENSIGFGLVYSADTTRKNAGAGKGNTCFVNVCLGLRGNVVTQKAKKKKN